MQNLNIGGFFGYSASDSLLSSLNGVSLDEFYDNTYIKDRTSMDRKFREKIFIPNIEQMERLQETYHDITKPNIYRPLLKQSDFDDFPQIMRIPVLADTRLRTLLKQGRIYGWDIKEEELPEEDVYQRLYDNGMVRDCEEHAGEEVEYSYHIASDDPVLHRDMEKQQDILECIMRTREMAKRLCEDNIDFSDTDSVIG